MKFKVGPITVSQEFKQSDILLKPFFLPGARTLNHGQGLHVITK